MNKKKSIFENPLFWLTIPGFFIFLFVIAVIITIIKNPSSSASAQTMTEAIAEPSVNEEAGTAIEEIKEETEAPTEEDKPVEAQLKDIIDSLNIKYSDLDIYQDDPNRPQYIIRYLSEETFWDEKDFVTSNISNYINICKEAYVKDTNKIELIVYVKMTDPRGNENEEKALDMCMTKDKFNQYNWENLQYSMIDFDILKSDCEDLYIHPGILKNVNTDDLYYK